MEKETLTKKSEKKIENIPTGEIGETLELTIESKKKKKFKKISFIVLNIFFLLLLIYFGFKVAAVWIITPILTVYGTAVNLFALTGDDSLFKYASVFAKKWLYSLIMLALAVIGFKLTRKKVMEDNKDE